MRLAFTSFAIIFLYTFSYMRGTDKNKVGRPARIGWFMLRFQSSVRR